MDTHYFLNLAKRILNRQQPTQSELESIMELQEKDAFALFPGANLIRETHFQNRIHLCVICNGKSGKCSEDCTFCAQSKYYNTQINTHPLLTKSELQQGAKDLIGTPVNRYSIVASGKGLPDKEIETVCQAYDGIQNEGG